MLSPLETGTARRRLRDVGGAGKPDPNAGSLLWRAARSAGKGQVPCISYMEGTLSYSARHKRLGQDRHAGKHSHGSRRHSWISQRKDRTETDSAEVPANQDARARPRLGAPAEE